jgi:imidazolonepropionase-like amidohydrolase
VERIEAERLIPGDGDPIDGGVVVLDGPSISYAGPADAAPDTPDAEVTRVPAVMPGMWDCHGHFFGVTVPDVEELLKLAGPVAGARIAADAAAAIDAGFTSIREPGGFGIHVRHAIEEGSIPGPHIYAAGAVLSTTGGHGDVHGFPLEWVLDLGARTGMLGICDGVPECLKQVRRQLRLGAQLIKVCASGGVMSEIDHPLHQQFSHDELRAIVEEAGRAERIVAAHCHGKAGIMAALEAGVATIEHGTYLDEEAADAMIETGAILVATRHVVERLREAGREMGVPDYAQRKLDVMADRHAEAVSLARDKGVRIAAGTDIFTSGPNALLRWGDNARELVHLVDAGYTPLEAIAAATADAPATLGPQAPRSGRLEEGYDADVIALTSDPTEEIKVLADPSNVTHVWRSGQRLKSPVTDGGGTTRV